MDQKKTVRPFSMKDKIGYTLGDLGCCSRSSTAPCICRSSTP